MLYTLIYKSKYNWILLLILIILPIIVFSINSWIIIWLIIELNLIIFLTFLILNNINLIRDLCIKYFLLNSFCSSVFLIIIFLNYFYVNNIICNYLINFIILIKLGIIPFHYWFIDLIINLYWFRCFILSTLQKLIPLIILIYIYNFKLIFLFILIRGLIRLIYTLNEINIKKVISFSSINHICWILISIIVGLNLFLIYYLSYIIISFVLFSLFIKFNINYFFDINKIFSYSIFYICIFLIFSIGGLPPFFGFLIKWFIIFRFTFKLNYFVLIILIFYSLFFLYYYIRLVYIFIIHNFIINKNNLKLDFFFNKFYLIFISLSIIFLLILLIYLN